MNGFVVVVAFGLSNAYSLATCYYLALHQQQYDECQASLVLAYTLAASQRRLRSTSPLIPPSIRFQACVLSASVSVRAPRLHRAIVVTTARVSSSSHPLLYYFLLPTMPKETSDIRDFLKKSRQKDAKYVKVKKGAELTKFKLRLSRYLYTLKVTDQAKADKIAQSFPPGLKKEDIK